MSPLAALARLRHNQLLRFGMVGGIGFVVDAGVLQTLLWLGVGPYLGRLVSFLAAATATWLLNRRYTFRAASHRGLLREWLHYLSLMAVGGSANYGAYALCVANVALIRQYPVIGVAVGSLAGMSFNFLSAKYLVFRHARPH